MQTTLHATCVSLGGKGVLLLGGSGNGKSDLALRLIDRGATLVADDQVIIKEIKGGLAASAPPKLSGLLEARGVGILKLPAERNVTLALAIKLIARKDVERLPGQAFFDCLGAKLPLYSLHAFDASTEAKIHMLLNAEIAH